MIIMMNTTTMLSKEGLRMRMRQRVTVTDKTKDREEQKQVTRKGMFKKTNQLEVKGTTGRGKIK